MNKTILCGRLGADPELRMTPDGTPVANFRIATEEVWKDKQGNRQSRTEWHRLVAWGPLAESVGNYTYKGREVLVVGRLKTRQWEDRDGIKRYTTEVHVRELELIGPRDKSRQKNSGQSSTQNKDQNAPSKASDVADEYTGPVGDIEDEEMAQRAEAYLDGALED